MCYALDWKEIILLDGDSDICIGVYMCALGWKSHTVGWKTIPEQKPFDSANIAPKLMI